MQSRPGKVAASIDDLASAEAPIYTRARFLPPARIDNATIKNSIIADGCIVESGAIIENSVVGLRTHIGKNVTIRNSVLMGADEFDTAANLIKCQANGTPRLGIGDGTVIERAIVDKNCRIGCNVRVVNEKNLETSPETDEGMICDGIVMIHKDAVLPDGWKL